MKIPGIKERKFISVCCGAEPSERELKCAYEVGKEIALAGACLVCGGLGGSMEAACKGAVENGGTTIGILPTYDRSSANPYVEIAVPTGLNHARNIIVVACGDGVIGVGGGYGTLSEIAIALKMGKPVVVLDGWQASSSIFKTSGFRKAETAKEAVEILTKIIG